MFKKLIFTLGAAMVMVAPAAEMEWMSDMKLAGKKAEAEDKLLLVEFTGSDWCQYCVLQKKNVLDKPEFTDWAEQHCVAVEIDVPHDASVVGGAEKKEINQKLCEEYGISSFPSLMLMSPEGVLIGGYNGAQSTPQAAIATLEKHFATAQEFKAAMKKKKTARAKALKAIYDAQPEGVRKGNFKLMELIAKADKDNKTGIQDQYRPIKQMRNLHAKLSKATDVEERVAILDETSAKAYPENKNSIIKLKESELYTAAFRLTKNPSSVDDICKARDYYIRYAECSGDQTKVEQIKQYYADPEKVYQEILQKKKK